MFIGVFPCIKDSVYIDDGYSGTNFDRPDFQRMIEDIEAGRINMVLTKDLSRLGRDYMNGQHILRPSTVNSAGYDRFYDGEDDPKRYEWSNNSVRGILRNPTYAGHLYTGKRPKPSFKSKKRLSALPEDYIIIPNVHEPIVSPEDYELVQTMITSRRNNTGREGKLENIFAGLIKCEDCGYALTLATAHRTKKDNILDNYGYMCNQYKTFGKSKCTSHWIEARDLYDAVLADIQRHAAMALADDEATDNAEQFTRLIREYAGIEELDAALLNTLIDKITVGEAKEVDGEKVQEVKIYYKFIGFIAGQES